MYGRYEGWMKHMDFILIDMLCLQLAFWLAYVIRNLRYKSLYSSGGLS